MSYKTHVISTYAQDDEESHWYIDCENVYNTSR